MDEHWLTSLDRTSCVLVPTRSLQTELQSQLVSQQIKAGKSVWASANILTWNDYLALHWAANRSQIPAATSLIDSAQSRILWERVVEQTQRKDDELALLNVAQTARAILRSWQLCHDWQLCLDDLASSAIEDTRQFGVWCNAYQELLNKLKLLDTTSLYDELSTLATQSKLRTPFSTIIWRGFDLITNAQQHWQNITATRYSDHRVSKPQATDPNFIYSCYDTSREESLQALRQARELVERNPDLRINIVVPNLQVLLAEIQTQAAEIFYPNKSPIDLQNQDLVYRFSLGQPVADWAAITTALRVLKCLDGRLTSSDLSWLLRNQFLRQCRQLREESVELEKWLSKARFDQIHLSTLPSLVVAAGFDVNSKLYVFVQNLMEFRLQLDQELNEQAEANRYRSLKHARWREIFTQWLDHWGWSTSVDSSSFSSVQFQLLERWQQVLKTFEGFVAVQPRAGLRKATDLILQIARDQVFLPKAVSSPIVISGVYEALGTPSDHTFLLGMNERYPTPAKVDPFIASALRESERYPSATPIRHLEQTRAVLHSLLHSSEHCHISYSKQDERDPSIVLGESSLFRQYQFDSTINEVVDRELTILDNFLDTQGPDVANKNELRGGTSIFTDQSNCAFRAFARHRLVCSADPEPEFGLDPLDRGNAVHALLEHCWQRLQSKAELDALVESNSLDSFIEEAVVLTIESYSQGLSDQKTRLLKMEKRRLFKLLKEWLLLEANRPGDFAVAGVEEQGQHDIGGISFNYKIDRIDFTQDGKTIVMDYKTGVVNRGDLHGERLRQPQLPLYVQAVTAKKNKAPAGVALAQVRQHDCKIDELSEADIFQRQPSHASRYEQLWKEAHELWPTQLEQLATEFLAGEASVNPIDAKTCQYCDLHALCRIRQMHPEDELETSNGF